MAIASAGARRARGRRGSSRIGSFTDINITPLTDVVLVLLVIFMVTAEFIKRSDAGMAVNLPSASNVANLDSLGGIRVAVTKDGQFSVDGKPVLADDLQNELKRAAQSPQQMIILEGDGQTTYQNILTVEDAALGAGMPNVYRATVAKVPTTEEPGTPTAPEVPPAKSATDAPFVTPAPAKAAP
jgi:biopolymer transport protein ExbD